MATTIITEARRKSFKGLSTQLDTTEPKKTEVSAEQEPNRLHETQDLLHNLRSLLEEGQSPGLDDLSDALQKVEEMTNRISSHPEMNPESRKILEDIDALLVSALQLEKNKHIAEHLKKISEESKKILKAARVLDVSDATMELADNITEFMNSWRPLFYLLMSSRDFRQLFLDTSRILRRIVYSYTQEIRDDEDETSGKDASVAEQAQTVKEKTQEIEIPDMTEEEFDRLFFDVQSILILLSKQPSHREGVERIFYLLEMFQKSLSMEPASVVPQDASRKIVKETEELVASFSGRDTLEQFKSNLRNLILQIQKNEKFQSYLSELKQVILKTKSEEEIRSEEFKTQIKELTHRGRDLMKEIKDQVDFESFLNSIDDMIDNITNDEFLQTLRYYAGVIRTDISFIDSQGQVQVDTDLLSRLQSSLVPVLADTLKYIPVPKIHKIDSEKEFWLDNVVLCSYDIIPQDIRFHLESDTAISLRDIEVEGTRTQLVIQLDKLLTELKDMEFYYHKKTFPEFEDQGKVTFRIKGNGAKLTFTYTLHQVPEETVPSISEGHAGFDISDMDIEFDKSTLKHPHMVPMLSKLWKMQIRREIEREVEISLNTFIQKLGDRIMDSFKEMNRPILSGLEAAKEAVKSAQMTQLYEKRREKLENCK